MIKFVITLTLIFISFIVYVLNKIFIGDNGNNIENYHETDKDLLNIYKKTDEMIEQEKKEQEKKQNIININNLPVDEFINNLKNKNIKLKYFFTKTTIGKPTIFVNISSSDYKYIKRNIFKIQEIYNYSMQGKNFLPCIDYEYLVNNIENDNELDLYDLNKNLKNNDLEITLIYYNYWIAYAFKNKYTNRYIIIKYLYKCNPSVDYFDSTIYETNDYDNAYAEKIYNCDLYKSYICCKENAPFIFQIVTDNNISYLGLRKEYEYLRESFFDSAGNYVETNKWYEDYTYYDNNTFNLLTLDPNIVYNSGIDGKIYDISNKLKEDLKNRYKIKKGPVYAINNDKFVLAYLIGPNEYEIVQELFRFIPGTKFSPLNILEFNNNNNNIVNSTQNINNYNDSYKTDKKELVEDMTTLLRKVSDNKEVKQEVKQISSCFQYQPYTENNNRIIGGVVQVLDQNGKFLFNLNGKLQGWTNNSVTIIVDNLIKTYDVNCVCTTTIPKPY